MNKEAQDSTGQEMGKLSAAVWLMERLASTDSGYLHDVITYWWPEDIFLPFLCCFHSSAPLCNTVPCRNLGITALLPFSILLFPTVSSSGKPKNGLASSGMLHAHVGCPFWMVQESVFEYCLQLCICRLHPGTVGISAGQPSPVTLLVPPTGGLKFWLAIKGWVSKGLRFLKTRV